MKSDIENCIHRKARPDDSADLLAWRNDPLTRANSLNQDEVDESTHQQWFARVLQDSHTDLLIYECNGLKVGTVRLSYSFPECELSWTVNPEFRGKGFSKRMVEESVQHISQRCPFLIARVRMENAPSLRIAEHLGMERVHVEDGVVIFRKALKWDS